MKTKRFINKYKNKYKPIFLALFCTVCLCCEKAEAVTVYALSASKGLLASENLGKSWRSDSDGLPAGTVPLHIRIGKDLQYLATESSGLFARKEGSGKWISISPPDFRLRRQFSETSAYRKISAIAIDPNDGKSIAAATKHGIYRSRDGGASWQEISLKGLGERNYVTALCIEGDSLYAGTSFNGFYGMDEKGRRFVKSSKGLPQEPYSGNLVFTEELSSVAKHNGSLYAGFRFGGGGFVKTSGKASWTSLSLPKPKGTAGPAAFKDDVLYATSGSDVFIRRSEASKWEKRSLNDFLKEPLPEEEIGCCVLYDKSGELPVLHFYPAQKRRISAAKASAEKRAIYSSIWAIRKRLDSYIRLIKKTGMNAIVVDMKDDFGNIYYPTSLQTAQDINAAKKPAAVKTIIEKLHKENIFAIARVVVFKDERLFRGYNSKYAIKDSASGGPWQGAKGEYWVDPHSKFVQDYNIAVGAELEKLGFDEIQFDYIRFPSDGPVGRCVYSFKQDKVMYKSEILSEFLLRAKSAINIPISTDIYGFNSWYSFGNWIGQDMEEFGRIVDAVCPMVYPSHFGTRFYMQGPRETRSYRIVYDGALRAADITAGSVYIRPYLQGFRLMSPTWGTGYIQNQSQAAADGGCSGFTFWNASGDYSMVEKALYRKKLDIKPSNDKRLP